MKVYLTSILSMGFAFACMASETLVKMPSKEVLAKRLHEKGFDHFLEKTKIADKLADRELYPLGVVMQVELDMHDYGVYVKNPMITKVTRMRQNQLIETLLSHAPDALTNLAGHGVYKSEGNKK